jgi:hypothetical protein
MLHVGRDIIRTEGFAGFYTGFGVTIMREVSLLMFDSVNLPVTNVYQTTASIRSNSISNLRETQGVFCRILCYAAMLCYADMDFISVCAAGTGWILRGRQHLVRGGGRLRLPRRQRGRRRDHPAGRRQDEDHDRNGEYRGLSCPTLSCSTLPSLCALYWSINGGGGICVCLTVLCGPATRVCAAGQRGQEVLRRAQHAAAGARGGRAAGAVRGRAAPRHVDIHRGLRILWRLRVL